MDFWSLLAIPVTSQLRSERSVHTKVCSGREIELGTKDTYQYGSQDCPSYNRRLVKSGQDHHKHSRSFRSATCQPSPGRSGLELTMFEQSLLPMHEA